MAIPLWTSIVVAVVAGLFAAVVAPLVTASMARRNWRAQKVLELKYDIFKGATAALAAWLTDALDIGLQSGKAQWKGMSRQVEMRPDTSQMLEQYRGLLGAFFSREVADAFDKACRTKVSIDNVPNTEFEDQRLVFVEGASDELGLKARAEGTMRVAVAVALVAGVSLGTAGTFAYLRSSGGDTPKAWYTMKTDSDGVRYATEAWIGVDIPLPKIGAITGEAKFIQTAETNTVQFGYRVAVAVASLDVSKVPAKYLTRVKHPG